MTPQQPKGEQKSADAKVAMARRLLEESMVAHGQGDGVKGEKYKAILKAITALVTGFGKSEDEAQSIMPAEMKTALLAPGGEPGPAPAAKAA